MTLQELISKRKALVDIQNENKISEGITRLLTDLYATSGHFVYELLQNAEDMNATSARFHLYKDKLIFEHNGTKRNFTLEDIDAITNIGHNLQKLHDPTSIGKFGVGFKSVYAYTRTPEIHSGEYHFKIKEYFIPQIDGVEMIETVDDTGVEWTKFFLPFDNPKKDPEVAFDEISKALKAIDDTSILFLRSINSIDYDLNDKEKGYSRKTLNNSFVSIEFNDTNKSTKTSWLRYQRQVEINDENNITKLLNISVAYSLMDDGDHYKVVPVKTGGKTFIYFPAESEKSGLRFHINAPFASTVGRETIRECPENKTLIKEISKLAADSIEFVKQDGYLDLEFLEVVPNDSDEIDKKYDFLRDYMISVFYNNEYIPTISNKYVKSKEAVIANDLLRDLFDENTLSEVMDKNISYAINPKRNSNTARLYRSLDVYNFNDDGFKKLFISNKTIFEKIIAEQNDEWLKKFYVHIYNCIMTMDYWGQPCIKESDLYQIVMSSSIIRTENDKMISPRECYYPSESYTDKDKIIKKSLLKGDEQYTKIVNTL